MCVERRAVYLQRSRETLIAKTSFGAGLLLHPLPPRPFIFRKFAGEKEVVQTLRAAEDCYPHGTPPSTPPARPSGRHQPSEGTPLPRRRITPTESGLAARGNSRVLTLSSSCTVTPVRECAARTADLWPVARKAAVPFNKGSLAGPRGVRARCVRCAGCPRAAVQRHPSQQVP